MCIYCRGATRVYMTRRIRGAETGGFGIYRRRECKECEGRFTTLERFVQFERQRIKW
jgi:transcriptional regulator NrdR family protein